MTYGHAPAFENLFRTSSEDGSKVADGEFKFSRRQQPDAWPPEQIVAHSGAHNHPYVCILGGRNALQDTLGRQLVQTRAGSEVRPPVPPRPALPHAMPMPHHLPLSITPRHPTTIQHRAIGPPLSWSAPFYLIHISPLLVPSLLRLA